MTVRVSTTVYSSTTSKAAKLGKPAPLEAFAQSQTAASWSLQTPASRPGLCSQPSVPTCMTVQILSQLQPYGQTNTIRSACRVLDCSQSEVQIPASQPGLCSQPVCPRLHDSPHLNNIEGSQHGQSTRRAPDCSQSEELWSGCGCVPHQTLSTLSANTQLRQEQTADAGARSSNLAMPSTGTQRVGRKRGM